MLCQVNFNLLSCDSNVTETFNKFFLIGFIEYIHIVQHTLYLFHSVTDNSTVTLPISVLDISALFIHIMCLQPYISNNSF